MNQENVLEVLKQLVNNNPNDYDLGKKVREFVNLIKCPDGEKVLNNTYDKK